MQRSWKLSGICGLTLGATVLVLLASAHAWAKGPAQASAPADQQWAERLAVAESVIAREEAASERQFDPAFRAKARERLAALPPEALLQAQTQEGGLGLNALGDSQADLIYTPVYPCRIIDTRVGGGIIAAGVTRSFVVAAPDYSAQGGSSDGCGVPFGPATAAMINFVAVNPQGPGFLQVTPSNLPIPNASIINFTAGVTIANGLVVAICDPSGPTNCHGGDIVIKAGKNATHLVADIQGYFQRAAVGGVSTALLADGAVTEPKLATGAVTTPKISNGTVVRSLNNQTDYVALQGSNGLSVSQGSGTVTVASNATPVNAGGTIVARDGSGNFSAGTITANLAGNATSAGGFLGSLAGEVTGPQLTTVVSNAVSSNALGAIVRRDGSGNFSAGTVGLAGNLNLPSTSSSAGMITLGGIRFLHNFGTGNSFMGANAGNTGMTGGYNSAFGYQALDANTTGYYNSAFGFGALTANTTGGANSAVGFQALAANTTGGSNGAVGYQALNANTTGSYNNAFGVGALTANTTGYYNNAFGSGSLNVMTSGGSNSAFGVNSLVQLSTGNWNTAIGYSAGYSLTSGDDNVYINNSGVSSESNTLRIGGYYIYNTYIAGIYGSTSASGIPVYVNSSGQLGTATSSRRYKEDIVDMDNESDVLMKLRPVAFYYKPEYDKTHDRQYGLVAEEVAQLAPQLVAYDKDGTPQTVRYHFVNAMLLNEVQRQRATIKRQESRIQDLEARLGRLEAAWPGITEVATNTSTTGLR